MIWLALMAALALSFLLSGIESAVVSVSRVRVRHAADEGDARATQLLKLIENRDALLGAVTVVNHVTNLAAFVIITWELIQTLGPWGYGAGFLIALPVYLVGLEVVPKTLFRRYPFRLLRQLLPLVQAIGLFRFPFKAFRQMGNSAGSALDSRSSAREDLKALTTTLAQQRLISQSTAALIGRVIDYKKWKTSNLMVPLTRITAVPPDLPARSAVRLACERGFSALPVLDETNGFAGILEMLTLPATLPADRTVRQFMSAVENAASDASALHTLQRLRKRGRALAIVTNSATGKPEGIVTEEDLLGPLLRQTS